MPITLSDPTRRHLVGTIQTYFQDERDETIGDLQAGFVLDFVLKEIGPAIYNQGLRDAQARLRVVVEDLDVALGEPEPGR